MSEYAEPRLALGIITDDDPIIQQMHRSWGGSHPHENIVGKQTYCFAPPPPQ